MLFQLAPSPGHGVRVYADEIGNPLISAITELERLQPRIQSPLFFVERAEEQNHRRLQFVVYGIRDSHTAGQSGLVLTHTPDR